MKATLTTEQESQAKALYKKYATLEESIRYLDHAERTGKKGACTKAFRKLRTYLEGIVTEQEAQNIIFNLINA